MQSTERDSQSGRIPLVGAVNRAANTLDNSGHSELARELRDAALPFCRPQQTRVDAASRVLFDRLGSGIGLKSDWDEHAREVLKAADGEGRP